MSKPVTALRATKMFTSSMIEAAAIIAPGNRCASMTLKQRGEIKTASGFSKGLLLMGLALGCASDTKETSKPTQNNGVQTTQSTNNTDTSPLKPLLLHGEPTVHTLDENCENTDKDPESKHHVLGGTVTPAPDTVQKVDTPTTPKKKKAY